MLVDIVEAYSLLVLKIKAFNRVWPQLVITGKVWSLPVLAEQKVPDLIEVQPLEGEAAIQATLEAMLAFERVPGQAPGTVMRLPGYFTVSHSVLSWVREINQLKDQVLAMIERTRVELNLAPTARSRILRDALGYQFSMKQLGRHTQAFDISPRLLVFTWAGHTTGGERITVGKVRTLLTREIEQQSAKEGADVSASQAQAELKRIVNLSDQATLIKYKKVAPHPRAMVYFSASTRYDAMIHSNLPMFVLAGDEPPDVHELRDFDRLTRQAKRPDKKNRIEVIPRMNLYLNPDDLAGLRQPAVINREPTQVDSTYSQTARHLPSSEMPRQHPLDFQSPED